MVFCGGGAGEMYKPYLYSPSPCSFVFHRSVRLLVLLRCEVLFRAEDKQAEHTCKALRPTYYYLY